MSIKDYYTAYQNHLPDLRLRSGESFSQLQERLWTDHEDLRNIPIPKKTIELWTNLEEDAETWLQKIKRTSRKRINEGASSSASQGKRKKQAVGLDRPDKSTISGHGRSQPALHVDEAAPPTVNEPISPMVDWPTTSLPDDLEPPTVSPPLRALGQTNSHCINMSDDNGQEYLVNLPFIPNGLFNVVQKESDFLEMRLKNIPLIANSNSHVKIFRPPYPAGFDLRAAVDAALSHGQAVVLKGFVQDAVEKRSDTTWLEYLHHEHSVDSKRAVTVHNMRLKNDLWHVLNKEGHLYRQKAGQAPMATRVREQQLTEESSISDFCADISNPLHVNSVLGVEMTGEPFPRVFQCLNDGLYARKNLGAAYGQYALSHQNWAIFSHATFSTLDHHDAGGENTIVLIDSGSKLWTLCFFTGPPNNFRNAIGTATGYMNRAEELKEENFECFTVLLEPRDALIQPAGILHSVYTPETTFNRGASFFSYNTLHLTEASRWVDHEHALIATNVDADPCEVYMALASLLSSLFLGDASEHVYYVRPLTALCLMLLDPGSYAPASLEEGEPVHGLAVYQHTIWLALRLAQHLCILGGDLIEPTDGNLAPTVLSAVPVIRQLLHGTKWDGIGDVVDVVAFVQKTARDSDLRRTYLLDPPPPQQAKTKKASKVAGKKSAAGKKKSRGG